MLHYITLHYITLYYTILYYIILHYIKFIALPDCAHGNDMWAAGTPAAMRAYAGPYDARHSQLNDYPWLHLGGGGWRRHAFTNRGTAIREPPLPGHRQLTVRGVQPPQWWLRQRVTAM